MTRICWFYAFMEETSQGKTLPVLYIGTVILHLFRTLLCTIAWSHNYVFLERVVEPPFLSRPTVVLFAHLERSPRAQEAMSPRHLTQHQRIKLRREKENLPSQLFHRQKAKGFRSPWEMTGINTFFKWKLGIWSFLKKKKWTNRQNPFQSGWGRQR